MQFVFEPNELPAYKEYLREARKAWVKQLLEHDQVKGSMAEAARIIGMDRSNFRRLMRDLGLKWVDD